MLRNIPEESLKELVGAAVAGSAEAFNVLYRRFSPAVHGVLLARTGPAEAEDLVQEVFLEGWQKLAQLRDAEALGGWLCTIARHKAADAFRRRPSTEPLPLSLVAEGESGAGAEARIALEALRRLPEAYREPLILRLIGGLTGPEIASVTGLTPGSVRVNLHRGMRMLREQLGVENAER